MYRVIQHVRLEKERREVESYRRSVICIREAVQNYKKKVTSYQSSSTARNNKEWLAGDSSALATRRRGDSIRNEFPKVDNATLRGIFFSANESMGREVSQLHPHRLLLLL